MSLGKIIKEEISGNSAKSFVAQISCFHRIQASTMFHEAAEYVKEELVRMGLDDPIVEQFASDGAKKYWTYTSPMGWAVKSAELRLVEPKDELVVKYEDTPQSLHTYSNATPPEGVVAELVDVGSGTKVSDYEGKDVRDKFVLATGRGRRVHELAIYRYGAAGVLTDTITYEIPNVRESIDIPDAHAYQSIWPTADELGKVKFGFSLSKRQGNQLRGLLKSGKRVKLKAKVDAQLFSGNLDIVTATIHGSSKPDEEVFLIAHLCHPKPSANDNASGSGLLIEIARTIKTLIDKKRIKRPARSIRFIWVPETYGSVVYLIHHEEAPRRMIAGLNLDMVGQDQDLCRSTLNLDRTPDSLPSYLNDYVFGLVEKSVKEFDAPSAFGTSSTFRYNTGAFSGGSDHAEFTDSTVGIPCVMLLQWPDLFYHTSMDTLDKVSSDSLKRVGWITALAALTLADSNAEVACLLAVQTASRAATRIEEIERVACDEFLRKREEETLERKQDQLSKELIEIVDRYRNKIEHALWREQQAVRSVTRLGENPELQAILDICCEDLRDVGRRVTSRIEEAVNIVARASGVILSTSKADDENAELNKLVPKRLFRGTLGLEFLKRGLGETEFEWYQEIDEKDVEFSKKAAEILNFMDGKRSLYEILKAVSAEYSDTKPEYVSKFVRDLEKLKLVSFQRS
jgi:aminopeptidase-like protein